MAQTALKEAKQRLSQLETHAQAPVVQSKTDLVFLALQLFLVGRIGFRAISRVLGVFANSLGIKRAPCTQTIINWVTQLSLVRIQAAVTFNGSERNGVLGNNGQIWMIDTSIALGKGKILTVLALDAHHHQRSPTAPGFKDVRCIGVSVADSWNGETIADFLQRLIASAGKPVAYLKDAGSDLQKAVNLLTAEDIASPSIEDISHIIANLLKHRYQKHPMFESFLSACGHVSGKLKQTVLACLAPPKVRTKARFMNLHRLVTWAERLLRLSPPGGAAKGSMLAQLRACFEQLPSCKAFIKSFLGDAVPLLECQKILKAQGLSHATLSQCQPYIDTIASASVCREFKAYLQRQLNTAKALGLEQIGLPVSSDQIESLFGLVKHLGAGEIKDADRMAIRLPALCGELSRAEAEQVLKLGVTERNKMLGHCRTLTKQRRDVFSSLDGGIKKLEKEKSAAHVELVPVPKTREKTYKNIEKSSGYLDGCKPPDLAQRRACFP